MAIAYNDKTGEAYTLINNEWTPTPNSDIADSDSGEVFVYDPEINQWKSAYVPSVDPEEFEEEGGYYGSLDVGLPIKTDYSGKEYKGVLGSLKKYFEQQTQSDILTQQGAARMGSKAVVETAKSPFKLAEFAGTMFAPNYTKEIKDAVANFGPVQAVDNYLNSVGLADLDPEVTPNEKIVSDLIGFMTIGTLGKKSAEKIYDAIKKKWGKSGDDLVEKSIKPSLARRATSVGGFGAAITHAGVQLEPDENTIANLIIQDKEIAKEYKKLRDNPETVDDFTTKLMGFLNEINNKLPESVKEAVRKLEVNPKDSEQENLIKRYKEEFGITTGIGGILLAAKYATLGIARLSNRVTSLVTKDRAANVPTTSKDTEVVSTEVKEVSPKLSEVEEKLVNEEATKRTRAWADKRATEKTPDAEVDMEAEKLLYNEKFEEFKLEVIKDLEFMGAIKPVRPTTKVEPEVASTGTATVKRTPDFKETGEYEVTLSNGEVHRIFRDTEQFSSPRWYRVGEDNLAGLGSTRKEAIEALEKRAASKPKIEPEVASTDTSTEPKPVIPKVKSEPKLSQRNKFIEKIGNVNTSLAKHLSTYRGLPNEVYEIILARENYIMTQEGRFLSELKNVKRAKKKYKVSDEQFEDFINLSKTEGLPQEFIDVARVSQQRIKKYNDRINDLLGLKGDKRINVVAEGEEVYYVKAYQAASDPKYYPQIRAYFAGANDTDDVIFKRIEAARDFFRGEGVPEDEIDSTIQTIVNRVSQNVEDKSAIDKILSGEVSSPRAYASLAKRKTDEELPPVIQELLGLEREPFSKIEATLRKQNRLLAEIEFVSSLRKYMLENVDSEVDLGKLFPLLPSVKAPINTKLLGNADQGLLKIAENNKGDLFDKSLALKNLFTSKALGDNIASALQLSSPATTKAGQAFRTVAAVGQMKETIFDIPAYGVNTLGMIQNLGGNSTLLYFKAYPEAIKSIRTFAKAVKGKDPEAVEEFALLREKGILDQDPTGTLLYRLANVASGKPNTLYQRVTKAAGQAYGFSDAIGKMISYNVRKNQLKLSYPESWYKESYKGNETYENFIINKAANFTADTMATYQRAPAMAQRFSRIPIVGNYILFTTEVLRTTKNIMKYAATDTATALARLMRGEKGAEQHFKMAAKQLAGVSALVGGWYLYVKDNNDSLKTKGGTNTSPLAAPITKYQKQIVNDNAAAWTKGSHPIYLEPFILDETISGRKYVRTRLLNSNTAGMWDAVKSPIRLGLAKIFGGYFAEGFSPETLDNAGKNALASITGQFASPKFFMQSILNIVTGVDKNGRPIYDKLPGETIQEKAVIVAEQLFKGTLKGGTYKGIIDLIGSTRSEELLGIGNGLNARGYPLNSEDVKDYLKSGQRFQTVNVDLASGFKIYNDLKELSKSQKGFVNYIQGKIDYKPEQNQEDVDNVINFYNDMQERRLQVMKRLTERFNVYKNVEYIRRFKDSRGDIQEERKVFGVRRVFKNVTKNFQNKLEKDLLMPLITELKRGKGTFTPDFPLNEKYFVGLYPLLKQKGFTDEQVNGINLRLAKSYSEFFKKPLVDKRKK